MHKNALFLLKKKAKIRPTYLRRLRDFPPDTQPLAARGSAPRPHHPPIKYSWLRHCIGQRMYPG